ncbi:hypothetical protein [Chryseobacterium lathyri]|uniref:hypothetical protein n=1 Tax=Chryseobacterium lathyri TaxID=395933 RepID=UPI001CBFAC0D|nr:hypothetical protein [Chryseobacterium lathyri]
MKKNNYLLLILSVFLFFGCRQESLYVDQESQNNSALKNYVINGSEIKKDVSLWSKLSGIQTHLFSTDLKSKKNDPLLDGAVIMTDYAGVMEKNGVTTYTFSIKRLYPSKDIENLVVRKNMDGSYSGLLMQYHLSKQELQTFQNAGKPEDIKGKISVYKINDINLNAKDSSGGYTYSEQIGCLVINYAVIPCTSDDQHTNPNQCALTGTDAPQIILMSVDDTHCVPSGNQGGSGSGSGTVPGGNQGGGSGGSTNNPPANPYNTFIFDSFDDMYNVCASGDAACEADRQLSLQVQAYLLSLSPRTSMLASYSPILQTIKDYFKTHGSADDTLTDRLALTASWFNAQDNTNPDLTLSNFKFADWLLAYFLNQDQNTFDYFKNHPNDIEGLKFQSIDYGNTDQIKMANILAPAFTQLLIAQQNNTVSQVNIQSPFWKLAKDYMIYLIKKSVPEAIRYGRIIYEHSNTYFKTHPNALQKINEFVEFMKVNVMVEADVQQDPHYMKWTDILLCWLFEIGDFPVNDSAGYGDLPTIGFSGADYTIIGPPAPNVIPMRYLAAHKMNNGVPDENSVLGAREEAISRIKQNNFSAFDRQWTFGSDATITTIVKLDGLQFCIGSYQTYVYITPLGNNQYKLTFIIKNKTGWQSGTRGLNDYDGNPTNDSIIPDQPRGTGVHLGGTIAQTYGWYEIITVN